MGRKNCHSFVNDGTPLLQQALEFTRYCRRRAAHREYNKLTIMLHSFHPQVENKHFKQRFYCGNFNIKLHFEVHNANSRQ
jgi:hypothetical protein